MAIRMQQRRGTSEEWTSANPRLASGEIGLETDTNKFKIGDDVNFWDDLAYFVNSDGLSGELDGYATEEYVDDAVSAVVGLAPSTLDTLSELATALGDDPAAITTLQSDVSALQTGKADLVDGFVPSNQLDIDLTGLATETYVDDAVAAIPAPDYTGLATESYADTAAANAAAAVVDSAPATLDTLNELAAALGDDANYATTITTALGTKAPLESPTFTGSVSFTGATVTGIDALPSQSGNSGKYLTTDGTNVSWAEISGGTTVSLTPHPFAMIG